MTTPRTAHSMPRCGGLGTTTMPMLGLAALLGAALLAATLVPAWATGTGPATKSTGFNCVIDLAENGLFTDHQLSAANRARYPNGTVSTLKSVKLCTKSANANIKIDCTAQIHGWKGGSVVKHNVPCVINGGACGVPGEPVGQPLPAGMSRLHVRGNGHASLSCQFKNEP